MLHSDLLGSEGGVSKTQLHSFGACNAVLIAGIVPWAWSALTPDSDGVTRSAARWAGTKCGCGASGTMVHDMEITFLP